VADVAGNKSTRGWADAPLGATALCSTTDSERLVRVVRRRLQVVQETAGQKFLAMRRKDQQRSLQLLRDDPYLR
jgi:hypothetical protein